MGRSSELVPAIQSENYYWSLPDNFSIPELIFQAEAKHPYFNVKPDILVRIPDEKLVCIEMFYTMNHQDSVLAYYILDKLKIYMDQWEEFRNSGRRIML